MSEQALVVDTSVLVAAVSPAESRHAESRDFLREVHRRRVPLHEPAHFLLELYAVLNRSPRELRQLGFMTEQDPIAMTLVAIGENEVERLLAWMSAVLPGRCPTKGADLAYVWVAYNYRLPLVTLDAGLHQFGAVGLNVQYPAAQLAAWMANTQEIGGAG